MPSLVAEQLRLDAPLASPLANDAWISLQWSLQNEHARTILSQTCTLTFAVGHNLTANVPVTERRYTFRLTKGMQVTVPMSAQLTVELAAKGANPAPQGVTLTSNQVEVGSKSTSDPNDDASKTVYGEMNQELRRTRTLYETFLVVVTGALATVFSKRSDIAGAYRPSIAYGLGFLALIVIYMVWQIAERYRKTTTAVFNLERSWGLRSTRSPDFPLDADSSWKSWWVDHAWRHTIWAIGLTLYAVLAIFIVIYYLHAPAEPPKASPPPVNVSCSYCPASSQPTKQDDRQAKTRSTPSGKAKTPVHK